MKDSPTTSRFAFVDALRGGAALGVLLHHLYFLSIMDTVYEPHAPWLVTWFCRMGAHGVEVFFVLSGFIIAHSLRANSLSVAALSQFMLRRQVRLDPPYWAALLLALFMMVLEHFVPGLQSSPLPTLKDVLLNVFYLHHLFHVPTTSVLLDVSWTLCLEIQFYLLFLVVLALFQGPSARRFMNSSASFGSDTVPDPARATAPIASGTLLAMWLSGAACLLIGRWVTDSAYFWSTWQYFVLGTLAYWAMNGKIRQRWLWSFVAFFAANAASTVFPTPAASVMNSHQISAVIVGCATALSLFFLGRRQMLNVGERASFLQYCGKISYSLYLSHALVVLTVMRIAYKLTGESVGAAILWFAFCAALCIAVAHVFYLLFERPSLEWTNLLKSKRPASTAIPQEHVFGAYNLETIP